MSLEDKVKIFLVDWVNQKALPQVRPGMSEDLTKFINHILADIESHRSAERMKAISEDRDPKETDNA